MGDGIAFEGNHFHRQRWPTYQFVGDCLRPEAPPPSHAGAIYGRLSLATRATSAKATADHTAMLVIGVVPGGDLLILDAVKQRMDISQVVPTLAQLCVRWKPAFVGLEEVGFSKLLSRDAARHPEIPPIRVLKPKGQGKLARAVSAIVKCERGEVHLPEYAEWMDDFITELSAFTGIGKNESDDLSIALHYAVLAAAPFSSAAVSDGPLLLCPGYGSPFGGDLPFPTPGKYGCAWIRKRRPTPPRRLCRRDRH